MTDELDSQIRTLFRQVADAAPPAPDLDGRPMPWRSKSRERLVASAAAAGVVAIGLTGVLVLGRDAQQPSTDGSPTTDVAGPAGVEVTVERLIYRQTADLTCATPMTSGGFDQAVIEAFADRRGQRWANTITYPDGSRREVIAIGDAYYPQQLAERGEPKTAVLGCHFGDDDLILAAEPAQGSFYSLNPLDDIPMLNDGMSMVPGYRDLGTQVSGDHQLAGQPVQLWRQEINGEWGFGGQRGVPGTQITEWFIEPETGEVLEWRFTTTITGVGTATETVTRMEWGEIVISDDIFNDDGYRTLPVLERPQPQGFDDVVSTVAPTAPPSSETVNSVCDTYTVRSGDYPIGIADSFGITHQQLTAANPDLDEDLAAGDILAIPCP